MSNLNSELDEILNGLYYGAFLEERASEYIDPAEAKAALLQAVLEAVSGVKASDYYNKDDVAHAKTEIIQAIKEIFK